MKELEIKLGMDLASFLLKNTPDNSHLKAYKSKDNKDQDDYYCYESYGYIKYEPVIIDYLYSVKLNKSYMTINSRYNMETLEKDGCNLEEFTTWFNKIIERDLL